MVFENSLFLICLSPKIDIKFESLYIYCETEKLSSIFKNITGIDIFNSTLPMTVPPMPGDLFAFLHNNTSPEINHDHVIDACLSR